MNKLTFQSKNKNLFNFRDICYFVVCLRGGLPQCISHQGAKFDLTTRNHQFVINQKFLLLIRRKHIQIGFCLGYIFDKSTYSKG